MRICILTPRFPFPETGGDLLRINNIARYLRNRGHYLILVSFCEKKSLFIASDYKLIYNEIYIQKRNRAISLLNAFLFFITGRPIQVGYYFSLSFLYLFKKIIREKHCDLFISHLLRMVPYLIKCGLQEKSIIEMTDALSKTYSLARQYKQFSVKRMVYIIEKNLIAKYEQYVINNFKKICLISQQDIDFLGKKNNLKLYPHGIYCDKSCEKVYNANKICFIGNMRTLQNQDAVKHFINDILPIIKQRLPGTFFVVIGAEPPVYIQRLSNNIDIFVTGFIKDIYEAISDACIAVAPIRIAAGLQNKVLMAMSAHIPVVLTPLIAGGIPELISGENCFIVEKKEIFAESCIALMTNDEKRKFISQNGYEIVRNYYSEEKMLNGYERF